MNQLTRRSQTVLTRWRVRTGIVDYYVTEETEHANTFIATPVAMNNGYYEAPRPITLVCQYILEQEQRAIELKPSANVRIERAVPLSIEVLP